MPEPSSSIVVTLRGRLIRGLRARTLEPGDRLPSARELVKEFGVDHRVILAAYRELASDGLIEIRERGGVYVRGSGAAAGNAAPLPAKWLADVFAEGLTRGIPAAELSDYLHRSLETLRLRAIVIGSTEDQAAGLARELHEDFGLNADGYAAAAFGDGSVHRTALRRADVFLATSGEMATGGQVSARFGKPLVTIDVRPDLVVGEWALLLRNPVWAVVATPEFGEMLKHLFAGVRGAENLHVLVYGRDDLSAIPHGAATYLTHRVRESIGVTPIHGRVLPPARTISTESARQIFDFIVQANARAMQPWFETANDVKVRHA